MCIRDRYMGTQQIISELRMRTIISRILVLTTCLSVSISQIVKVALEQHTMITRQGSQDAMLTSHANSFLPKDEVEIVYNTQLVGEISLGEPPQKFRVIFDTGSGVTWINGKLCYFSIACWVHRKYDGRASSTWKNIGDNVHLAYMDGTEVKGYLSEDDVTIAGIKIKGHRFAEITSHRWFHFASYFDGFDGIVGLGKPIGREKSITPLFTKAKEQGVISSNSFSIYLGSSSSKKNFLAIGGVDYAYNASEFNYYPTPLSSSQAPKWTINLKGVYSRGKNYLSKPTLVLIDSGTSSISGPKRIIDDFLKDLPETPDCDNPAAYPDIDFLFRGQILYTVKPQNYMTMLKLGWLEGCIYLIDGLEEDVWILGIPFLTSYYTHFDADSKRIGFARPKLTQNQ
eukprot:TRINITY_DN4559_c0_g1_i4.p1 TRINITY_DN4559_c0_g1~~TRINITY_DN4559_c0_g1_i4.p1  ORF type:complete len:432 (+),score=41.75 TRINITY_DN4559_c0_g1_i4:100-1296(+)